MQIEPDGVTRYFEYDPAGNRTRLGILCGGDSYGTDYAYDALNRMTKVTSPDDKTTYYEYDAASREVKRILGNQSVVYHNYDAAGRLTSLLNVKSDLSAIATFYYTHDKNSNITRVDRDGGIVIYYEYDPLQRLTREKWQDGTPQVVYSYQYDYDPSGNRLKMIQDGTETYYHYNAANELLWEEVGGVYTYYTYDDDGNTLTKEVPTEGAATYYEWTQANMMKSAAAPGKTVNYYGYDGALMRHSKIDGDGTTYYTWDGLNPILERAGDGTVQAQYTHGQSPIPGIGSWTVAKRGASYQFPHMNQIGSVFNLTNTNETVTQTYEYDAFGNELEVTGSQTNLIRYSSHILDEDTALIYNFAREYDPQVGRFAARDVAEEGINHYSYAFNNPVVEVDPSGTWAIFVHPEITKAAFDKLAEQNNIKKMMEDRTGRACWSKVRSKVKNESFCADIKYYHEFELHYTWSLGKERGGRTDSDQQRAKARTAYLTNISKLLNEAYQLSTKDKCEESLKKMGIVSHMWEDFFGHGVRRSMASRYSQYGVVESDRMRQKLYGSWTSLASPFTPADIIPASYDGEFSEHGPSPQEPVREGTNSWRTVLPRVSSGIFSVILWGTSVDPQARFSSSSLPREPSEPPTRSG
ncbi:MAG: RHS repeat-associated core domain-containing protein, partial [Planctomycetota bacterium]